MFRDGWGDVDDATICKKHESCLNTYEGLLYGGPGIADLEYNTEPNARVDMIGREHSNILFDVETLCVTIRRNEKQRFSFFDNVFEYVDFVMRNAEWV